MSLLFIHTQPTPFYPFSLFPSMIERDLITYSTWERYTVLAHIIFTLSIKDRRIIFQLARTVAPGQDVFFPRYGMSFSEFAVFYTLGDGRKKKSVGAVTPPPH